MSVGQKFKAHLLIVDDGSLPPTFERRLDDEGYAVTTLDMAAALEHMSNHPTDALLVNLQMVRANGLELIKLVHEEDGGLPIVAVGASSGTSFAVDALRSGAEEYVLPSLDGTELVLLMERVLERSALRFENENLHRQLREHSVLGLEGLMGASPAMQRVYRVARQVAKLRATVLLLGEKGTGKRELARTIHALGPRADKPFVQVDCGTVPESRLETELFGHEGAPRLGCFERAYEGTVLLRDVELMAMVTQVKLLRVLREMSVRRRGGRESIPIDARLLASTSRQLATEVRKGRFREDLYHRLSVVQIEMPPLRERGGDVLILAHDALRRIVQETHKPLDGFTDAARIKLVSHSWPGNVQALESAIDFAAKSCRGSLIDEDDLPFDVTSDTLGPIRIPGSTMAELERHAILKTLEATGGSTSKAAELLDISVRTIQYRLHQYHVTAKDARIVRQPER